MGNAPDTITDDAKANLAAQRMRDAFFSVYGDPEQMTPDEAMQTAHTFACLHVGCLIEWAIRFAPDRPIQKTAALLVKVMIATNKAPLATVRRQADPLAFLKPNDKPN
ncbi:hypothetical protein [Nitrospirillum bahiense]|uniref:Uncharacterized protein n=1 Tax=Nitrospirillum amazonense TaxID=28077 RepID=A0A560F288_9PROT|nr:hypothetical protein [Nitrospirillum amazonense]TWB15625.1 hypothetical protein FBZ88_12978 [Nitrospirillum amazonense]